MHVILIIALLRTKVDHRSQRDACAGSRVAYEWSLSLLFSPSSSGVSVYVFVLLFSVIIESLIFSSCELLNDVRETTRPIIIYLRRKK